MEKVSGNRDEQLSKRGSYENVSREEEIAQGTKIIPC